MSKDISPIKAHAVGHNSHYAKGINSHQEYAIGYKRLVQIKNVLYRKKIIINVLEILMNTKSKSIEKTKSQKD